MNVRRVTRVPNVVREWVVAGYWGRNKKEGIGSWVVNFSIREHRCPDITWLQPTVCSILQENARIEVAGRVYA